MKESITINAQARKDVGKGASRRLRRADQVPGILYGAGKAPVGVTVEHNTINRALANESFYTRIFNLNIDGASEQVVLKDLQRHPFKPRILHMDLQRVSATEKLTMRIPLHFFGGDVAPGVKIAGGMISHQMSGIEVRCLPKDLPEFIDVDLSKLELNQAVHLSDLKLAPGVEIVDLIHGEDKSVATAYIPRAVVEEEVPVAPAEVKVIGEEEKAEGEAAEGDAKAGDAKDKDKDKDKDKGKGDKKNK